MDWLLSLIPGGGFSLIGIIGALAAGLLALWRMQSNAKKAGRDEQIAKEAKYRDETLDRIKRAADAKPTTDILHDPNNRDTRRK